MADTEKVLVTIRHYRSWRGRRAVTLCGAAVDKDRNRTITWDNAADNVNCVKCLDILRKRDVN